METYTEWLQLLSAALVDTLAQIKLFLPRLVGALALLLVGWLVARLLRLLSVRLVNALDKVWQGVIARFGLYRLEGHHPPARIIGGFVFWIAVLFFVTTAADVVGLGVVAVWLSRLAAYLPVLLAGVLIVFGGFLVSGLVRDVVSASVSSTSFANPELAGRVAQALVLITAVLIGVDQAGIDVQFIADIMAILVAAVVGGAALAFGVGARTLVSNLLAIRQVRQLYAVGDTVRVNDLEGQIRDMTPTAVVLETAAGRMVVPGKAFDEAPSLLKSAGGENHES